MKNKFKVNPLKWESVGEKYNTQNIYHTYLEVKILCDWKYTILHSKFDSENIRWEFSGSNFRKGYVPTIESAKITCQNHYEYIMNKFINENIEFSIQ